MKASEVGVRGIRGKGVRQFASECDINPQRKGCEKVEAQRRALAMRSALARWAPPVAGLVVGWFLFRGILGAFAGLVIGALAGFWWRRRRWTSVGQGRPRAPQRIAPGDWRPGSPIYDVRPQ